MYIRLAFVASHICEIPRNSPKIRTYSRSPKVIDLGVNGKRICDFLLVINSNYGQYRIYSRISRKIYDRILT